MVITKIYFNGANNIIEYWTCARFAPYPIYYSQSYKCTCMHLCLEMKKKRLHGASSTAEIILKKIVNLNKFIESRFQLSFPFCSTFPIQLHVCNSLICM